jgi:hypothetical protein
MAAALFSRLGRTPVRDVLFQTMATFADMAGIRLGFGPEGEAVQDLDQARMAIDTLGALVGVSQHHLGPEVVRPFVEPLTQLHMAYAEITGQGGEPEGDEPGGPGPQDPPPQPPPPEKRIWTPPGTRR